MWLTTKVDVPNQPTMERPVDDWKEEDIQNNVTLHEHDESFQRAYFHKQEDISLCMKLYIVCLGVFTVFVYRAMFV
jgi:hypothetical protein